MDSDSLRAFIAVANQNSFSKAAQTLHLTQPAISKRISVLEENLGCRLFDRVGKQVQLTQAGVLLRPKAEAILSLVRETKQTMIDLSGKVAGELHIATSHHIGLHKLPPVLRQFSQMHPEVSLRLNFLDSEVAIEQVHHGHCELGIVTLPTMPIENMNLVKLWRDPLVFVAHPSLNLTSPCGLFRLSQKPAILPDLSTYTGRLIKACFERQKVSLTNYMATNYLETIKMMVSVGLGWSVLPKSMLDDQLVQLDIDGIELSRDLGVATHQRRHLSNAALAFCELLGSPFAVP